MKNLFWYHLTLISELENLVFGLYNVHETIPRFSSLCSQVELYHWLAWSEDTRLGLIIYIIGTESLQVEDNLLWQLSVSLAL